MIDFYFYYFRRYYLRYISFIFMLFLFGCSQQEFGKDGLTSKVNGKSYSVRECYNEMAIGDDIIQEGVVDKIIVYKSKRVMELYRDNELIDTLSVSLGANPIGKKIRRGDNKTPEGQYWIDKKICSSKYYRSLSISYPHKRDLKRGIDAGGGVTIHAQPSWNCKGDGDEYTLSKDWTHGCIAISNKSMERLWYGVREGVPIEIKK